MLTIVWTDSTSPLATRRQGEVGAVIGDRHPDVADQALGLQLPELVDPVALGAPGRPPQVHLQQVEAVDAQLLERPVGAGPDLAAGEDLLDVDRHPPAAAVPSDSTLVATIGASPDQDRSARPTTASDSP